MARIKTNVLFSALIIALPFAGIMSQSAFATQVSQKPAKQGSTEVVTPHHQKPAGQEGSTEVVAPHHSSPSHKTTLLRMGNRGEEVKKLQSELKRAKVYEGPIDGFFGKQTEEAVIRFQESKRLTANGMVDAKTWSALQGR